MGRARRPLEQLMVEGSTYPVWVPVQVQTTVGTHAIEVLRWLPQHIDLQVGVILQLADSGDLRWVVLQVGPPHRGQPTGEYLEAPRLLAAPAPLPTLVPGGIRQTSHTLRDRQQRRQATMRLAQRIA